MYDLQTLIFYAKEKNTSDVHLTVGLPPMLRIDGELRTSSLVFYFITIISDFFKKFNCGLFKSALCQSNS